MKNRLIAGAISDKHYYKTEGKYGVLRKFCSVKNSYFDYFSANESESQGGVERCNQCGEIVSV